MSLKEYNPEHRIESIGYTMVIEIPWRPRYWVSNDDDNCHLEGMSYEFFTRFDRALFNECLERFNLYLRSCTSSPLVLSKS